jgi:hypothetical protein
MPRASLPDNIKLMNHAMPVSELSHQPALSCNHDGMGHLAIWLNVLAGIVTDGLL